MTIPERSSFSRRLWLAVLIAAATLGACLLALSSLGNLGEQLVDQLNGLSGVFIAIFTLALLFIERERDQREAAREAAQIAADRLNAEGVAWLARRSCEAAVRTVASGANLMGWSIRLAESRVLDRLERRFRTLLRYAGRIGPREAEQARAAFEPFLAAVDRIHENKWPTERWTSERGLMLCEEAAEYLRRAAVTLEAFAPRRPHEPQVPAYTWAPRLPPS